MSTELTTFSQLPDPDRVRRGRAAIATARARGKFAPAFEPTCVVCGGRFTLPPSRRRERDSYRCPACIAAGRYRCAVAICGNNFDTAPGFGGQRKCPDCRASGLRGPTLRPRVSVEVRCVGAAMPWGGGRRHARGCARTREMRPSEANDWKRERADGRHQRTDGWRSRECFMLQRFVREHCDTAKSLGYRLQSWGEFTEYLRTSRDVRVPGRHPKFIEKKGQHPAALIAARREGRGGLSGPARSRLQMSTTWRKPENEVKWELRQCRLCERLLLISTAPTAKRPDYHDCCWKEWKCSDTGRSWASQIKFARQRGETRRADRVRDNPPLPPLPPGKRRTTDSLKRNFGWAVRYLLGGDSQSALAAESHFDQSAVARGVQDTLALLPEPDKCDARLRRYVEALREASASRA